MVSCVHFVAVESQDTLRSFRVIAVIEDFAVFSLTLLLGYFNWSQYFFVWWVGAGVLDGE